MPQVSPVSSSAKSNSAAKGSRERAHLAAAEAFSTRPSLPLDSSAPATSPDQRGRRRLSGAFLIELDRIEPDPDQPRKRIDPAHLDELTANVRELGVLSPITVRYVAESDCYRIIAGECRFTAARKAGLKEIPCWVKSPDQERILLEQIVENWHRSDLNAFELADSLAILRDSNGLTQQQLAETTGKSPGEISRLMSILDLPPRVQEAARNDASGRVSKRHLYALKTFSEDRQLKLLSGVRSGKYTAESLERLAEPAPSRTPSGRPVNWQYRTFKTKTAEVRFLFRKPEISDADILQALREVRSMVTEDAADE